MIIGLTEGEDFNTGLSFRIFLEPIATKEEIHDLSNMVPIGQMDRVFQNEIERLRYSPVDSSIALLTGLKLGDSVCGTKLGAAAEDESNIVSGCGWYTILQDVNSLEGETI